MHCLFLSTESDDGDGTQATGGDGDGDAHRDGIWMPIVGNDPGPTPIPFIGNAGPKHAPPADSNPMDYVKLFINDALIDIIVRETNRYADQWIREKEEYLRQKPRSLVHLWIEQGKTTKEEIYAFLSVTMNMGLLKKPTIKSYWNTCNPSQSTPWFCEHFSRDRYTLLLKFLHFADNATMPAPGDPRFKLYKIQPLVDHFNKTFKRYYQPSCDISIDESMIGYKGKTPYLRQYMPQKHHARFGVKLWCLCDSVSSYTCTFEVFKGAADPGDRQAEGMTYSLVMRLMKQANLLHRGHHLGLDNYFTSPKLLIDLYSAHTTSTGTVRRNRKGLPVTLKTAKLQNKSVFERRKRNLLCVAYKDNTKQPVLLSTKASAGYGTATNSKGKQKRLPKSIILYNKAMGGVDMSDARLYAYLSERRTMKWTSKVAFALVGRSVLNAYILYSHNTSDTRKKSRYEFVVSAVEGLMGNFRPPNKQCRKRSSKEQMAANSADRRPLLPPVADVEIGDPACKLEQLSGDKRRKCVYKHPSRTRTRYQCPSCDVGLCATCFHPYHAEKDGRQQ